MIRLMTDRFFLGLLGAIAFGFAACSCKTAPAPDSGFLPRPMRLERKKGANFQRVWQERDIQWSKYKTIKVASIDVSHLMEMGWWQGIAMVNYDDTDVFPTMEREANRPVAREFAQYFEDEIKEAFIDQGSGRVKLVDVAHQDSLILELAIVELVPVKKYFIGLGLVGDGSLKGGSMAIEGKLKDGATGKIIAMFADRKVNSRMKSMAPGDTLTWYSHAKPLIKDWSALFVDLANGLPEGRMQLAE